jgi:hypothetical protein
MRREAGEHENFFIAKNRDSESAKRVFRRYSTVAATFARCRSMRGRITKTSAAQAFPSILIIVGEVFSRAPCLLAPMRCCVDDQRVSRVLASARQYFLKQDTVFFNVLVYSGCSAFRFPSARSD